MQHLSVPKTQPFVCLDSVRSALDCKYVMNHDMLHWQLSVASGLVRRPHACLTSLEHPGASNDVVSKSNVDMGVIRVSVLSALGCNGCCVRCELCPQKAQHK